MADDREQALLARVDVDGALLPADATDGFQLAVTNAAANKLDAWLGRSIEYRATVFPDAGLVRGEVTVTLTNDGPTEGLPPGVIDNYLGDPVGTNRSLVSLYSPHRIVAVSGDDGAIGYAAGAEAGLDTATVYLTLPPGESITLTFTVAGLIATDATSGDVDYDLTVRTQPLVLPADYTIDVIDDQGNVFVGHRGPIPGTTTFVP